MCMCMCMCELKDIKCIFVSIVRRKVGERMLVASNAIYILYYVYKYMYTFYMQTSSHTQTKNARTPLTHTYAQIIEIPYPRCCAVGNFESADIRTNDSSAGTPMKEPMPPAIHPMPSFSTKVTSSPSSFFARNPCNK